MAWFVSRRNCQSFLTANTVAGSLDGAHRSGRATGHHQDPAATLLLPRRTPHPFRPPPHPASAPTLALGKPVQSRPDSIARLATPFLTPPPATDPPPDNPGAVPPTGASPACQCHCCPPPGRFRPSPPLLAAIFSLAWPPDTILNPICWHRAWPVRLPLPVIPTVNAHASSLRWIRANPGQINLPGALFRKFRQLAFLFFRESPSTTLG